MATISANLGLTLPESFDKVDIDIISGDFEKIDEFAGEAITSEKIANNLTTVDAGKVLDARQGKALSDQITELDSAKASTAAYTATLAASGWSGTVPYTQTVSVAGILATDNPFVDVDMSGATGSTGNDLTDAWTYVGRVTANNGSVTAYCYEEKPTVNLPIILKVVR